MPRLPIQSEVPFEALSNEANVSALAFLGLDIHIDEAVANKIIKHAAKPADTL